MIYFFITAIIIIYAFIGNVNKSKFRKILFLSFSFGLLIFLSAFRKNNVGIDLEIIYTPNFYRICDLAFVDITSLSLEKGFSIILKLLSFIREDIQVFTIFSSLFSLIVFAWFFFKESKNVAIPTVLFILSTNFYMSMNVVRQFIAIAIILIAYHQLKKGKSIMFALLIMLASSIHSAAIIMLFIPLLSKIRINKISIFFFITIIIISFVFLPEIVEIGSDIIYTLTKSSNKNYTHYLTGKYSTGTLNFFNISEIVISLIMLFFSYYSYSLKLKRNEDIKNDKRILIMSGLYFLFTFLYIRMSVISRLGLYFFPFALISFSNGISNMTSSKNRVAFTLVVFFLMLIRFSYITLYTADNLFGVLPYSFFWE